MTAKINIPNLESDTICNNGKRSRLDAYGLLGKVKEDSVNLYRVYKSINSGEWQVDPESGLSLSLEEAHALFQYLKDHLKEDKK